MIRLFPIPSKGRWRREVCLQVRRDFIAIRLDKTASNNFRSTDLAIVVCRYLPPCEFESRSLTLKLGFHRWRVFDRTWKGERRPIQKATSIGAGRA